MTLTQTFVLDRLFPNDQEDMPSIVSCDSPDAFGYGDWNDSDDSYERVCDENWTGELMKMLSGLLQDQ
ncbi:hypothetical protein Slin15195_G100480 [Septoria linicola]|uniref:Uncharacterized protein n=1 Tax=Septoria linicola TaxID=215465 RepID=A0A9Q9ENL6_9PEZI|nr:hypothetical protein Slin15195_G100480 [Septoria linicola]